MRHWHGRKGIVYLLHLSRPYKHARHYIGYTNNLEQRLADHRAGRGSKLIAAAVAAGITFVLARTWEGDQYDERKLHRRKSSPKLCPICRGKHAAEDLHTLRS